MVMIVSQKYVHDMALKHKWLKEAKLELFSTLDYIQSSFGEQTVQKVPAGPEYGRSGGPLAA